MSPLKEDFARWREDPITRLVFKALEAAERAQKAAWDKASWDGGVARPDALRDTLMELRVRADCYASLAALSIEDVTAWLGIENAE